MRMEGVKEGTGKEVSAAECKNVGNVSESVDKVHALVE